MSVAQRSATVPILCHFFGGNAKLLFFFLKDKDVICKKGDKTDKFMYCIHCCLKTNSTQQFSSLKKKKSYTHLTDTEETPMPKNNTSEIILMRHDSTTRLLQAVCAFLPQIFTVQT